MARLKARKKPRKKVARRRSALRRIPAAAHISEAALAAFAHDIRTALTGILALGELLASSDLGERERNWASNIKSSAEHLAALTTLILDAARANASRLALREEAFDPRRLLRSVSDSLAARAQTKDLATEVSIADDLPEMLLGDPVRLRAALENLLENAVKFTERGAVRLEVRAKALARGRMRLDIVVADSGIGLAPAEIKRLFRPFAQARADIARRYGGSGLGLAVTRQLARLMGGDLTVTSKAGTGSCFRFTAVLPLAQRKDVKANTPSQHKPPARQIRVLCAEDNPYGRVILNTILSELGHRADFVESGEEAVAAVIHGYDVVLMDVTFPGIDGLEAARRIRALGGQLSQIPIIGITGRSEAGDEQAARSAGMNFYLRKPVSPSTLSEAIAAVLPPASRASTGSCESTPAGS